MKGPVDERARVQAHEPEDLLQELSKLDEQSLLPRHGGEGGCHVDQLFDVEPRAVARVQVHPVVDHAMAPVVVAWPREHRTLSHPACQSAGGSGGVRTCGRSGAGRR